MPWEKAYEELTWCQADDIIKLCPKEREKIIMTKDSEELTNARKDELDEYLKEIIQKTIYPANRIATCFYGEKMVPSLKCLVLTSELNIVH